MASILPIPARIRDEMRGRSWRDDPRCPPFDSLRLLVVPYLDFDGVAREGESIVAASVADEVVAIFEGLHRLRFPIRRVDRIDLFEGDDDASMEADNCSAFNFRSIPGTNQLSHHGLGVAIDVNPRENPMIVRGVVHPPSARDFVDRTIERPGMILADGPVVALFRSYGWHWGGDWDDLPDYHHFSKLPRRAGTSF